MPMVKCVPVTTEKGWAIVNPFDSPWCYPTYIRFGGEGAAWSAFQQDNGQGHVSVTRLKEQGYRCIQVLVAPVEPFVEYESEV